MKKVFNYFAKDVQRSWRSMKEFALGTENIRNGGDLMGPMIDMINPTQARAAIIADRAVTLTGIFTAAAAFVTAPAYIAVPAFIGYGVLSRAAGYLAAYGVNKGIKAVEKKLTP